MGAGMPEPGPGQHQERLGGGHPTSDRRRLRRHLQKLGGALQKARPPRRQVRQKILRNKHPPSSNRCHFIYTFAFVCIHTSYITKTSARVLLGNNKAQRAWNVDSEVVVRYNTVRLPLPGGFISSLLSIPLRLCFLS
jgi:hypothetical protein